MRRGDEVVDRAERKAIAERVRRGEPAPTATQARTEMAVAERIRRAWWLPCLWLVVGLSNIALFFVTDHGDLRPLAALCVVLNLALAVHHERHRRWAARLLDVNRRRWGDG